MATTSASAVLSLGVDTPQGFAGRLGNDKGSYYFNYAAEALDAPARAERVPRAGLAHSLRDGGAVLEAIAEVAAHKDVCLEVTTLVIPGCNDGEREMEMIRDFLASCGREIPFHLSAYYPRYEFDAPPTPVKTLERLKEIAGRKLAYVYLGNVGGSSDTRCRECGSLLVERNGYRTKVVNLDAGKCARCGKTAPFFT